MRAMMSTQQQVESNGAKIRHVVPPESSSPWCSGAGTPHRTVEVAHSPRSRLRRAAWRDVVGFLRNSHQATWSDRHGLEWDDRETYAVLERPRWHVEATRTIFLLTLVPADLDEEGGFRGGQNGRRNRDGDPGFLASSHPGVGSLPSGSSSPIEPRACEWGNSCATPPRYGIPSFCRTKRASAWASGMLGVCGLWQDSSQTQTGSVLCTERGGPSRTHPLSS